GQDQLLERLPIPDRLDEIDAVPARFGVRRGLIRQKVQRSEGKEKARLRRQPETAGAPDLRGAPERGEVEMGREVLFTRTRQKILVGPMQVVREERAAAAL